MKHYNFVKEEDKGEDLFAASWAGARRFFTINSAVIHLNGAHAELLVPASEIGLSQQQHVRRAQEKALVEDAVEQIA